MKKLIWISSSYKDFLEFPPDVKRAVGYALYCAQLGQRHISAKTLSHMGSAGIAELREYDGSGTYRVLYSLQLQGYVFVLHAFQKKSRSGIATPKQELDLIKARLKEAKILYETLQDKGKQP